MPSSSVKAAHYRTALGAALVRGAWVDTTPGSTPSGSPLSWSELVRKWGKHTGGNTTLIHHIREISLLYLSRTVSSQHSSSYVNVTHDQVKSLPNSPSPATTAAPSTATSTPPSTSTPSNPRPDSGSFVHIPHPHLHKSHKSLDHTQPSAAAVSDRRAAYLSISDLDAEPGTTKWIPLDGPEADEAKEGITAIEALMASGKLNPAEVHTAQYLLAYHYHAIGEHNKVLSIYEKVDWSNATAGAVEGDAAVLDRMRGRYFQGLSLELTKGAGAIQAYTATVDLLPHLTSVPFGASAYLPSPAGKVHPRSSFDSMRELARVLSTALVRSAYLSARTAETKQTLQILRMYQAITTEWPATFRPAQRTAMFLLYLRSLLSAAYHHPTGVVSASEAKNAFRFGQQWLGQTTSFPRAGNVNQPVVQFVELVVAFHPFFPELSRDIISVLWWSTNFTFQSHSALRNLARLLAFVGESKDARRTFELYVELVLKSRQTSQPDISLQLKRRPTDDMAAGPDEIRVQEKEAQQQAEAEAAENANKENEGDGKSSQATSKEQQDERKEQTAETESDPDPEFIDALVFGSRMFLRDFDDADLAWKYASLAGDVARGKGDLLVAKAEECKGIVRGAMASRGFDPATRPIIQAQAIDHLRAAVRLNPNSASAQYHLAYAEAEARALEPATEAVRASLELDSRNVQAWHLLALLLTSSADWEGAAKACDAGIGVWEQNDEDDGSVSPEGTQQPPTPVSGIPVESKDFAVVPPTPELPSIQTMIPPKPQTESRAPRPLLSENDVFHPLLKRKTRPDHSQRLNDIIRLRSTRAVITERMSGPEAAMLAQQELFAFFSSRSALLHPSGGGGAAGIGRSPSIRSRMSFRSPASLIQAPSVRSRGDLGGSYVSIDDTPDEQEIMAEQNAASTTSAPTPRPRVVSTELAPPIVMTGASSPGSSSPGSGSIADTEDDFGKRNQTKSATDLSTAAAVQSGREKLGVGKGSGGGLKPKHLNPSSARAGSLPGSSSDLAMYRSHTASNSTSALSLAPTIVGSFYRTFGRSAPTQSPPSPPLDGFSSRPQAEARTLSDLWLSSAGTFRRWSKPEQALVAIEEAEQLDPDNPGVWCQLGMYHFSQGAPELAAPAFTKALLLSEDDYPAAIVGLSRVYLERSNTSTHQTNHNPMGSTEPSSLTVPVAQLSIDPQTGSTSDKIISANSSSTTNTNQPPPNPSAGLELASSLLIQLTTNKGWDIGEAWFRLGQIYEKQGKSAKAIECYNFAMSLEEGRPCRPWKECVDRWL